MKHLGTGTKIIIGFLITTIILYLFGAFVAWDLFLFDDIKNMDSEGRFEYLIFYLIFLFFSFVISTLPSQD